MASYNKGRFASRTAFEALAIDDESSESEDEPVMVEQPTISPKSSPQKPSPKLTKTAAKKAAKAAREAKKQKQNEATKKLAPLSTSDGSSDISSPSSPSSSEMSPTILSSALAGPEQLPPSVIPAQQGPVEVAPETDTDTELPTISEKSLPDDSIADDVESEEVSVIPSDVIPVPPVAVTAPVSESEQAKKRRSILERTLWTFIMIGGFVALLLMGHIYMILLVMMCQSLVYREVTALFSLKSTSAPADGEVSKKDPWSKTLNWYFFAVTNYFLYGESIIYYFKHVIFSDVQLLPFATNHRIISFTLYSIGFMGFVMSLKKGYLKQQFGLFCWVHMSLFLIVVSSHFIVNNILEGLIWFWVPACLVICNDIFAYIWGMAVGRTPLIKLSPKKTVEGFVGAFFSTIIFSLLWGTYFMRFKYMICPVHDIGISAFDNVTCTPNPVFVWKEFQIWSPLDVVLSTVFGHPITTIPYVPYQFHLFFMACFASLVAPFGGFFASGFKRAFDIKDFGHSIPGHGGMTDRMDCQFLMGVFTYVYYSSLIRRNQVSVGSVLQTIVNSLTPEDQLELMTDLKKYLDSQGIPLPF